MRFLFAITFFGRFTFVIKSRVSMMSLEAHACLCFPTLWQISRHLAITSPQRTNLLRWLSFYGSEGIVQAMLGSLRVFMMRSLILRLSSGGNRCCPIGATCSTTPRPCQFDIPCTESCFSNQKPRGNHDCYNPATKRCCSRG